MIALVANAPVAPASLSSRVGDEHRFIIQTLSELRALAADCYDLDEDDAHHLLVRACGHLRLAVADILEARAALLVRGDE